MTCEDMERKFFGRISLQPSEARHACRVHPRCLGAGAISSRREEAFPPRAALPDRARPQALDSVDASGITILRVPFRHAAASAPDAQAGPL